MKLKYRTESSDYDGLEDNEQFDDGSNRQEAEQIAAYFHQEGIKAIENNGVINIVDKHGILEGLPDGRRFGELDQDVPVVPSYFATLPVGRVITPGRDPNFTNDLFVIWVTDTYGVSWLINYGDNWNVISWQQWQGFQEIAY